MDRSVIDVNHQGFFAIAVILCVIGAGCLEPGEPTLYHGVRYNVDIYYNELAQLNVSDIETTLETRGYVNITYDTKMINDSILKIRMEAKLELNARQNITLLLAPTLNWVSDEKMENETQLARISKHSTIFMINGSHYYYDYSFSFSLRFVEPVTDGQHPDFDKTKKMLTDEVGPLINELNFTVRLSYHHTISSGPPHIS